MPIYEYQCESCEQIIETMQGLADKPLSSCPSCAGSLKKLISQSSFQLKGGGWYSDGYSNGNSSAKSCAASASSAESAPSCPAKESSACGGCC